MMPPGSRALAAISKWFDPTTVTTVFEPLVADWQRQWIEARGSQRPAVWMKGASALTISACVEGPRALLGSWPAGTPWRIIARVTLWTVSLSLVQMSPFAIVAQDRFETTTLTWLTLFSFPASATLALPFAVTMIPDIIRRASQTTRNERLAVVWSGIVAGAVMLLLVGWANPASRHMFRTTERFASMGMPYRPNTPKIGALNELSILELPKDDSLNAELWRDGRELWPTGRAEAVRTEIASRTAMIALPITLLWIRWRALRWPRGRWYSPLPLALSAPLLYVSAMLLLGYHSAVADIVYAPRWLGPWLTLVVLAVASIGVDRMRRRAARGF